MGKIRLTGATSGYTEIQAASAAGNNTIILPTTNGGQVIVSDSSGNVNIDSGTFYVDASNNRVGIGVTNPGSALNFGDTSAESGIQLGNGADFTIRRNVASLGVQFNVGADLNNYQFRLYGSEVARIDSFGRLLIGTSTSRANGVNVAQLQLEGTDFNNSTLSITANINSTDGSFLHLGKSRGTTVGSNTIVQNGDLLGLISFNGADGNSLNSKAAAIGCIVDGTPGANDMPGRLVFSTTADGASSPTERMRIGSDGLITISGPGIKFPATQVASTDPNTLDDYEEGTWTPVIDNAYATAPTVTYTSRDGWYRKCGSLVTVYFKIVVNTYSGGGGPIQLDGMPFGISSYTPGNIIGPAIVSGIAPPASTTGLYVGTFRLDNGGERLVFFGKSTGTTAESNALCIQSTSSLGGCTFRGSFSYIV
jgi:hypothetical protein